MFDWLDCLSVVQDTVQIHGRTISREMVKEKGFLLAKAGTLSDNPVRITSSLIGWSDNKTTTTMVNNRVLSLVKFRNKEGEVVKATATFHAEVDGTTHLASLLVPTPLADNPLWDEDVLGVMAQWGLQLQLIADIVASEVNGQVELFTRSSSVQEYLRVYAVAYVLWIPNQVNEEKAETNKLVKLAKGPKIRPSKPTNTDSSTVKTSVPNTPALVLEL